VSNLYTVVDGYRLESHTVRKTHKSPKGKTTQGVSFTSLIAITVLVHSRTESKRVERYNTSCQKRQAD